MAGLDELLALRRLASRRIAESLPYSPEWDAAMASLEDLERALREWTDKAGVESQECMPSPRMHCLQLPVNRDDES